MRDIKTLLQVVIDSLKEGDKIYFYNFGICGELDDLMDIGKLSVYENELLHDIIKNNKPSPGSEHSIFLKSNFWKGGNFWWDVMDVYPETRQVRIDYLTALKNSL